MTVILFPRLLKLTARGEQRIGALCVKVIKKTSFFIRFAAQAPTRRPFGARGGSRWHPWATWGAAETLLEHLF